MSREYVTRSRCGGLEMFFLWCIPAWDLWDQGAVGNSYFCTVAIRSTTSKYFKLLQRFPLLQGRRPAQVMNYS